jgi:hypothetical protein
MLASSHVSSSFPRSDLRRAIRIHPALRGIAILRCMAVSPAPGLQTGLIPAKAWSLPRKPAALSASTSPWQPRAMFFSAGLRRKLRSTRDLQRGSRFRRPISIERRTWTRRHSQTETLLAVPGFPSRIRSADLQRAGESIGLLRR